MEEYPLCNVCGLHRATLHLDEVVEGALRMTAHLCDDCWYRLGIRIPLGNIWRHIQQHRDGLTRQLPDPVEEVDRFLAQDDLGELLNPSGLAVAEPDEVVEDAIPLEGTFLPEENSSRLDRIPLESEGLDEPIKEISKGFGIDAVRVNEVHPTLISLIPRETLLRCKAVPVRLEGARLTVAIADPFDTLAIANLEMYLETIGMTLTLAIADEMEILKELHRHGGPPSRFESLS